METASEIKAFNKLFADYHGLFVRFANTYLQDEAAAEDIAVEGIMYYWENRHSLSSDSNIPAYILEAIKHKCLNYLRHLRVREDVEQRIQEHQQPPLKPAILRKFSVRRPDGSWMRHWQ
jgi:RNA polymerase sigma-70 factor (ECF subfamily)